MRLQPGPAVLWAPEIVSLVRTRSNFQHTAELHMIYRLAIGSPVAKLLNSSFGLYVVQECT